MSNLTHMRVVIGEQLIHLDYKYLRFYGEHDILGFTV